VTPPLPRCYFRGTAAILVSPRCLTVGQAVPHAPSRVLALSVPPFWLAPLGSFLPVGTARLAGATGLLFVVALLSVPSPWPALVCSRCPAALQHCPPAPVDHLGRAPVSCCPGAGLATPGTSWPSCAWGSRRSSPLASCLWLRLSCPACTSWSSCIWGVVLPGRGSSGVCWLVVFGSGLGGWFALPPFASLPLPSSAWSLAAQSTAAVAATVFVVSAAVVSPLLTLRWAFPRRLFALHRSLMKDLPLCLPVGGWLRFWSAGWLVGGSL
jgi:hypothetical protein